MSKKVIAYRKQNVEEIFRSEFKSTKLSNASAGTTKKGEPMYGDGEGNLITETNLMSQAVKGIPKDKWAKLKLKHEKVDGVLSIILDDEALFMSKVSYARNPAGEPAFTVAA